MNKAEFMEELKKALGSFQNTEMDEEVISDINAHFDEALRAGQSEAQICEMLGNPNEIAAQFHADGPSEAIKSEVVESSEISCQENKVNAGLYVDLCDADLICAPYHGSAFQVEVRHQGERIEDNNFIIRETENGLEIRQKRPIGFVEHLFRVFKHRTLFVGVPAQFQGDISVKTLSGDVRIDTLSEVNSFICKVTSGNVNIDGVSTLNTFSCNVVSGNIKLSKVKAMQVLCADTKSGNVTMDQCTGDTEARSLSGNVHLRSHKGSVTGKSFSGNVRVDTDCITKNSYLETKSGEVNLVLDKLLANLALSCLSGNIKFSIRELAGDVNAETTSGNVTGYLGKDVNAYFRLESTLNKSSFAGSTPKNQDVPTVYLKSSFGNVRVKEL